MFCVHAAYAQCVQLLLACRTQLPLSFSIKPAAHRQRFDSFWVISRVHKWKKCLPPSHLHLSRTSTVQPSSTRRAVSAVRIKWNKTKSKLKRCRCQRLLSALAVRASSRFIFSFSFFFLFFFSFGFRFFSFCFCFCNKVEFGTSVGCS